MPAPFGAGASKGRAVNLAEAQPYTPTVEIVDFVAGAQAARGVVVVIDVFRAFSLAAYAFDRGVRSIIPVASLERARQLKQQHRDYLLIGERHARPLPGFDHGNSPAELLRVPLAGRTLIHTTHAGTQGLTQASAADEVLTGALVNAAAIVHYLRARRAPLVTLVRMGQQAIERCAEDDLCAELIALRLKGEEPQGRDCAALLRTAPSAAKFFDPACPWAPLADFDLCTRVDCFDFVLRLDCHSDPPQLRKVTVEPTSGDEKFA
jgi:2-phosphosulfolactate phosphatase